MAVATWNGRTRTILLGVTVALGALWLGRTVLAPRTVSSPPSVAAAGSTPAAGDVEALRREVSSLRSQVERVQHVNGALATELARGAAAPQAPREKVRRSPPRTPEELEAKRAEAAERHAEQARALQERLTKENVDREWASTIEAALAQPDVASLGVKVSKVDCRETICRLDLNLAAGIDPSNVMIVMGQVPGAKSETLAEVPGADGAAMPVAYVMRHR